MLQDGPQSGGLPGTSRATQVRAQQWHTLQLPAVPRRGVVFISAHQVPAPCQHAVSKDSLRRIELLEREISHDLLLHHSSSERALVGGHARALRQLSLHIAPGQRAPFGIRRYTEVNVRSAGVHGFGLARGVPSLLVHPLLRRAQRLHF